MSKDTQNTHMKLELALWVALTALALIYAYLL